MKGAVKLPPFLYHQIDRLWLEIKALKKESEELRQHSHPPVDWEGKLDDLQTQVRNLHKVVYDIRFISEVMLMEGCDDKSSIQKEEIKR